MSHTEPSPSSSALWVCPWVGHRDVSALRNTPSLVSLLVCVFPQECLQQTLPIWGCSGAVKPRDESLCILTHLTTRCKLRISGSPFSGGSFGWIWVELQGFACCFAWQMNGWGCPCSARWILFLVGTRSHPCSCSTGATCGRFTCQKSPGTSGLICCERPVPPK